MFQETPTLLTVARWGARLGMHPLHLQQVDVASTQTTTPMCGQPVLQYGWQNRGQRTSREDIATAIATAEEQLASFLGYSVLPDWVSEDVRLVDQDWRPVSGLLFGPHLALRGEQLQLTRLNRIGPVLERDAFGHLVPQPQARAVRLVL